MTASCSSGERAAYLEIRENRGVALVLDQTLEVDERIA
jgi:hypothetical protein